MRAVQPSGFAHFRAFSPARKIVAALTVALLGTGMMAHSAFASLVNKIAFGTVSNSTQIVLDLTSAPKDLQVEDLPGKPMTVSFTGKINSATKTGLKQFSWPNLSQVYYEEKNGRVQIFIKRNIVGTATVDAATDGKRLVVRIPNYYYKVNNNDEIAPGVRHTRLVQHSAAGPLVINVLDVDPKYPGIEIAPALASGKMGAKSSVAGIVNRNQAIAGINGSFFKQDKGIPLGILMINQELISGPIFDRVALGVSNDNNLAMSQIRLGGDVTLPNGQKLRVHNINQPRTNPQHTVIYSARWGQKAPPVPGGGMQVQLRGNRVTAVSTTTPLAIPRDGVVVSGPPSPELTTLANLSKFEKATLNVYTLPDWSNMKHAIGGGPYLVKNGRPYVDARAQHFSTTSLGVREPRSAAGITRDGHLLLVTVDGRQKSSVGMTLNELAYLMQKLGAVDAMNFDGGSSTQMAVYGKVVNSPSSGQVPVANSLLIRRTNGDSVAVDNEGQSSGVK